MIHYESTNSLTDGLLTFDMLRSLEELYPGFHFWYMNKALPDIVLGRGSLITAKHHHRIVGVALGKTNEVETKLRCVRVLPEYQKRGVGIHLCDRILTALDSDKPICTVPEEMFHDFGRIFVNRFDFDLTRVEKGLYRPSKLEYVFNGVLAPVTAL